jgi:hypothetical protein
MNGPHDSHRIVRLNQLIDDYNKVYEIVREKRNGFWPKLSMQELQYGLNNLLKEIDFYMVEQDWAVNDLKVELGLWTDYSR